METGVAIGMILTNLFVNKRTAGSGRRLLLS